MPKWLRITLRVLGAVLLVAGLGVLSVDLMAGKRYDDLADRVATAPEAQPAAEGGTPGWNDTQVDFDDLWAQNDQVVAWLEVDGTSIATPVVKPYDAEQAEWYLRHDLWGNWAWQGTAFLDPRCDPKEGSQLVFGHHFNYTDLMFSDLYDCWEQEAFDQLGEARWTLPDEHTWHMRPLCALMVDEEDQEIQRVSFEDDHERRAWLRTVVNRADAWCGDWDSLARDATHVVSLVTCASLMPGQRERTVVVFVGTEPSAPLEQGQAGAVQE